MLGSEILEHWRFYLIDFMLSRGWREVQFVFVFFFLGFFFQINFLIFLDYFNI